MSGQNFDTINQPEHYAYGSIECKDYLEAIGIAEDYYVGCIIKYLTRYKRKNGLEDLKKASRYMEYLLSRYVEPVEPITSALSEEERNLINRLEVRPNRMYSPMGDK